MTKTPDGSHETKKKSIIKTPEIREVQTDKLKIGKNRQRRKTEIETTKKTKEGEEK